jgi:ubiquitin carboxyl-terminal hydrolase L3
MSGESSECKQWIPLESNPALFTKYCHQFGVPEAFSFHDVYGTDPELLSLVPRPVLAVLLLFPITPNSEKFRVEEAEQMRSKQSQIPSELFFTKQTISNAW